MVFRRKMFKKPYMPVQFSGAAIAIAENRAPQAGKIPVGHDLFT
jgi:hypothetical protein